MDIQEIVRSYLTKITASENDKKLADLRLSVCDSCESKHKTLIGVYVCKICGCALGGKAFTPLKDRCPLGKWNSIEAEFFQNTYKPLKGRAKML